MKKHNVTFAGEKTKLFIYTIDIDRPVYATIIKQKKNGEWESFEEGKTIKFSFNDLISIMDISDKTNKMWSTFHTNNDIKTPIAFAWDEYDNQLLWINIDDYARPLKYPDTKKLELFLKHIVMEKIETLNEKIDDDDWEYGSALDNFPPNKIESESESDKGETHLAFAKVNGKIKINKEKAILIVLSNDEQELWTPKSVILNTPDYTSEEEQEFEFNEWFSKKSNL